MSVSFCSLVVKLQKAIATAQTQTALCASICSMRAKGGAPKPSRVEHRW